MIRGYIVNSDLMIMGIEPEMAKHFANCWDLGINTKSKLSRLLDLMIKYKNNESTLPIMKQEFAKLVNEKTDEKRLPYPLVRAIGKKVRMVKFKLKIEDDSVREKISNMAAGMNINPSELVNRVVKKYVDSQRQEVACNE